jgi:hypothetical protein
VSPPLVYLLSQLLCPLPEVFHSRLQASGDEGGCEEATRWWWWWWWRGRQEAPTCLVFFVHVNDTLTQTLSLSIIPPHPLTKMSARDLLSALLLPELAPLVLGCFPVCSECRGPSITGSVCRCGMTLCEACSVPCACGCDCSGVECVRCSSETARLYRIPLCMSCLKWCRGCAMRVCGKEIRHCTSCGYGVCSSCTTGPVCGVCQYIKRCERKRRHTPRDKNQPKKRPRAASTSR